MEQETEIVLVNLTRHGISIFYFRSVETFSQKFTRKLGKLLTTRLTLILFPALLLRYLYSFLFSVINKLQDVFCFDFNLLRLVF